MTISLVVSGCGMEATMMVNGVCSLLMEILVQGLLWITKSELVQWTQQATVT
jgi:hypothetical protein